MANRTHAARKTEHFLTPGRNQLKVWQGQWPHVIVLHIACCLASLTVLQLLFALPGPTTLQSIVYPVTSYRPLVALPRPTIQQTVIYSATSYCLTYCCLPYYILQTVAYPATSYSPTYCCLPCHVLQSSILLDTLPPIPPYTPLFTLPRPTVLQTVVYHATSYNPTYCCLHWHVLQSYILLFTLPPLPPHRPLFALPPLLYAIVTRPAILLLPHTDW